MIIILYHLIIESSCQWVLSNTTSFRLRTHRPLPKAIIKKGPKIVDKQMVYLEQKKKCRLCGFSTTLKNAFTKQINMTTYFENLIVELHVSYVF